MLRRTGGRRKQVNGFPGTLSRIVSEQWRMGRKRAMIPLTRMIGQNSLQSITDGFRRKCWNPCEMMNNALLIYAFTFLHDRGLADTELGQ